MKQLLITLTFLLSSYAAAWDFSAAVGSTGEGQTTLRVGATDAWQSEWFVSDSGRLTGYWDVGLTFWDKGNFDKTRYSISASPVLVYEFTGNSTYKPFIEAGIGLALFSGTKVGDQDMGSALHFEDRIGAGVRINNRHVLGIRAIHYSNAGFKKPNQGIESYHLYYRYQF